MWYAWLPKLYRAIGRQASAIGAAIAALVSALIWHRHRVSRAERAGRTEGEQAERERITQETDKQIKQIRQRADEIKDEVKRDTGDPDDLLERLRRESTDYGDQP